MGKKIRIDDVDYDLDNLSDKANASVIYLEFITTRLQELKNMKALLKRARNSYIASLKKEIISDKAGLLFDDD
tara:strand:- start:3748 stop:3966 length:219 start_codon:yes stop_codon:yes gene_type:complete